MTNNNVTYCTTTLVRKKSAGKWLQFRYDVTSGHVTDVTSGHVTNVTPGHLTDVTSCHMTDVTSGHLTYVTSGHVTSVHVTSGDVLSGDVTSGSTPFPNYDGLQILKTVEVLIKPLTCGCRHTHRVMMKNHIIFWKPIIRFSVFWKPLYCNVFYVI